MTNPSGKVKEKRAINRLKNFKFKLILQEGEMLPSGFGVAYREMDRWVAVAYPIPFNVIIGSLRRVWLWFRFGHKLYEDGFQKGYNSGYSSGRDYAFNQFKKQVIKQEVERLVRRGLDSFGEMVKLARKDDKKAAGYFWKVVEQEEKRIEAL